MIRRAFALLAVLALVMLSSYSATAVSVADIVNQTSVYSYTDFLQNGLYTHNGDNRGPGGAQHDAARTTIVNAFQSYGLTTALVPFTYSGQTWYNVIGTKLGTTRPNDYYMVGAHFDSANTPGADDNASGVAGVLEAARVLSHYSFESSLVFSAFDMEEAGMQGSWAYANTHASDNILGMICLDMIAYNPAGANHDMAYVYGTSNSSPIKNALASAVITYGNGLLPEIGGSVPQSDHWPFEYNGFQACLLIEHSVWSNPYYHRPGDSTDTPNYIDYNYATNMTRSAVGYLAASAGVVEPARIVGITNRAAHDPIIAAASSRYQFKLWGHVTILGTDSFELDDGSGMPITVVAPGFSGIGDGDYATASGSLSGGTLTSTAGAVLKLH